MRITADQCRGKKELKSKFTAKLNDSLKARPKAIEETGDYYLPVNEEDGSPTLFSKSIEEDTPVHNLYVTHPIVAKTSLM